MSFVMTGKWTSREPTTDYKPGGRPLTGWKVLGIFVGLFAIVAAANAVMIFAAVKTFRGEVVQHPYERGLAYNREIAQARAQDARNWRVDVSIKRDETGQVVLVVLAREPDETPVAVVDMAATFIAPADARQDAPVKLVETGAGRYEGHVAIPAGIRDLVITAIRGGKEVFRSSSRVAID